MVNASGHAEAVLGFALNSRDGVNFELPIERAKTDASRMVPEVRNLVWNLIESMHAIASGCVGL